MKNFRRIISVICAVAMLLSLCACSKREKYDAVFITDVGEKINALTQLMKHQTGVDRKYEFAESMVEKIYVCKITADEFTAKARK